MNRSLRSRVDVMLASSSCLKARSSRGHEMPLDILKRRLIILLPRHLHGVAHHRSLHNKNTIEETKFNPVSAAYPPIRQSTRLNSHSKKHNRTPKTLNPVQPIIKRARLPIPASMIRRELVQIHGDRYDLCQEGDTVECDTDAWVDGASA